MTPDGTVEGWEAITAQHFLCSGWRVSSVLLEQLRCGRQSGKGLPLRTLQRQLCWAWHPRLSCSSSVSAP